MRIGGLLSIHFKVNTMSQTHYRLLADGYIHYEKGKAYPPDYRARPTSATVREHAEQYPSDWRKVRIRTKKYKPPTWAMVRELEAQRGAIIERFGLQQRSKKGHCRN